MLLVTHDGKFHFDEVAATVVLLKIYPDAEIIRTRNRDIIESGDIVYDVGGVYDQERNRFDHHHASFSETFDSRYTIKLSSSGLIYKYYGEKFLERYGISRTEEHFKVVFEEIYSCYFLSADAIDNGYEVFGDIVPRSLSHVVASFNPLSTSGSSLEHQNKRFLDAVRFVFTDMDNFMDTIVNMWLPGYKSLERMLKRVDGDILHTEEYCLIDMIPELEKKHSKDVKFVLNRSGEFVNILAVPKRKNHFETKIPLKKSWRGLSGKKLEAVSNIEGSMFVHASGFFGSNKTVEGAVRMCKESIEEYHWGS